MPCFDLIYDTAFKGSIRMPFFAMPSHRSEQWAFQNGVFPDKHWLPRASYYIHHFENGPVRNLVLRAFSKKRHAYALFCI
jgi:hypothetical protein